MFFFCLFSFCITPSLLLPSAKESSTNHREREKQKERARDPRCQVFFFFFSFWAKVKSSTFCLLPVMSLSFVILTQSGRTRKKNNVRTLLMTVVRFCKKLSVECFFFQSLARAGDQRWGSKTGTESFDLHLSSVFTTTVQYGTCIIRDSAPKPPVHLCCIF